MRHVSSCGAGEVCVCVCIVRVSCGSELDFDTMLTSG